MEDIDKVYIFCMLIAVFAIFGMIMYTNGRDSEREKWCVVETVTHLDYKKCIEIGVNFKKK